MEKELPEVCRLCLQLSMKNAVTKEEYPRIRLGKLDACRETDTSVCLPKDRTMIILLDMLLKKLNVKL